MTKKLEGKVAIITGGASGIGAATARKFAEHGARAVVIADVQEEKGIQVSASIRECDVTFIRCDVTDEKQVNDLVKSTVEKYGQLDIMFSNAGVLNSSVQDILSLDLGACDALFSVNVRGAAACVKHAGRAMAAGGRAWGGSIICTASVMGSVGASAKIDYAMSKHAVVGLVRCAAKGLGEHGIRVNCVSPGPVATPMTCGGDGRSTAEEFERRFEGSFGIKGLGSLKAEDVADAVVFLASDESRFVTGHDLVIDGGFVPGKVS